jgi:hypothetical protein
MPGKSDKHWAVRTVVVPSVAGVVQKLGDLVVDLQAFYIRVDQPRDKCEFNVAATNLLIVLLGGNEIGSNLSGLNTRLQSCLGTLESIVGTVDVPSDTTNGSSTKTRPEKGFGRALWCFSGVFSETGASESRNPVRGGRASSQTGGRAERGANGRGEHGRMEN